MVFMGKIYFNELSALLEHPKGEENIIKLFKDGKYETIKKINKQFNDTGIYDVCKLNELFQREIPSSGKMTGVFGPKGCCKSTVASTDAFTSYIDGKSDDLRHLRYDPKTGKSQTLFSEHVQNPKNRDVILDDISYLAPSLAEGLLSKGSVRMLDEFTNSLVDLDEIINEKGVKTKVYCISDANSLKALQSIFTKVMCMAGQEELVSLLPRVSKQEVNIDEEFFGKTYARLGGKKDAYEASAVLAELINEKNPKVTASPRLLKQLIDAAQKHDSINYKIFRDKIVAKEIIAGRSKTPQDIQSHINQRAVDAVQRVREELIKSHLDDSERYYSADERVRKETKEGYSSTLKALAEVLAGNDDVVGIRGSLVSIAGKLERSPLARKGHVGHKILESSQACINTIDQALSDSAYYSKLFQSQDYLAKQNKLLDDVKSEVEKKIAQNPQFFSNDDAMKVKNLVNNPGLISINPHTIDLIRERAPIPY
jgi:hypothetical protein